MRILLVEDDADLAQFIRKGLKEEQHAVDVANDGEAGLALALDNPYDLVILDIMLPKLDGLTVCRRIRDKGLSTPVLLLTARNTVETKVSAYDTGADQFWRSRSHSWNCSPGSEPSCGEATPNNLPIFRQPIFD